MTAFAIIPAMTIAQLIKRSGLSEAELARRSGLHRSTLGRYRLGVARPETATAITALARALGVHPSTVRPDLAAVFRD